MFGRKHYITSKEAAAMIGVKPSTLRVWRATGKGPAFIHYNGNTVYYEKSEVQRWINKRTKGLTRSISNKAKEQS